ncbi:MAG: DUF2752 domain-containing protein [Pedobacter sp.]|nr:MAG: DUF2752 domain-containing protein [Pedobacter sp.]
MHLMFIITSVIHWIEAHLLSCPFKAHTGVDCPGCGFQRSIIALIQGDVQGAFGHYPPSIPIAALVVFVPLHLKFDFKNGAMAIKLMYATIAIVIVLNYIYKIYTHKLF